MYRQSIRSLKYLYNTRPNVGLVSQVMEKLGKSNLVAARKVLRCIKGTINVPYCLRERRTIQ